MRTLSRLPRGKKQSVDWNESVGDILEAVDEQLKEHGLEIVLLKSDDDNYEWVIVRKKDE